MKFSVDVCMGHAPFLRGYVVSMRGLLQRALILHAHVLHATRSLDLSVNHPAPITINVRMIMLYDPSPVNTMHETMSLFLFPI